MPSIKENLYDLIMEKENIWNQAIEDMRTIDDKIQILKAKLLNDNV